MKIAVVGCGAVGSFYGARLVCAGHDVHFLLRSDYEMVRRQGVCIRSVEGDFQAHPVCARQPQEIGPADVVLIGLKSTANEHFAELLPPLVGPQTAVLTLQNGMGNEESLAHLFPPEQILGGLCFVCLNRVAPGVIEHIGYGLVVLGEYRRKPLPRTHEIAAAFHAAGVPCNVTDNLERAHWEKLVWNIPFNGLGVAGSAGTELLQRLGMEPCSGPHTPAHAGPGVCLTTDRLLADNRWAALVRQLMMEVIGAARALGFEVSDALADKLIERTRSMGAYKASTLLDYECGRPLELQSLFLEPLRRATQAGAAVPKLSALCDVLRDLSGHAPAGLEADQALKTRCT